MLFYRFRVHRVPGKAANYLVVRMRTEKIGLKKFLHSRKMPGFDSQECPCRRGLQSAKHVLIATHREKEQDMGGGLKGSGLQKVGGDVNRAKIC